MLKNSTRKNRSDQIHEASRVLLEALKEAPEDKIAEIEYFNTASAPQENQNGQFKRSGK